MSEQDLEIFEHAFPNGVCGCHMVCDCGRAYWDSLGDWDWDAGEKEALATEPNATALPHAPSGIEFEGRTYVADCKCWHARAERIMAFLVEHREAIGEFFRLKGKALQEQADSYARVGGKLSAT